MADKDEPAGHEKMAALVDEYVTHLAERSSELTVLAQASKCGRLTDAQRDELVTITHKLAGTGATYGFPTISEAARDVERLASRTSRTAALELDCEEDDLVAALSSLILQIDDGRRDGPASSTPMLPRGSGRQSGLSKGRSKPYVLVVDDDPHIREVLSTTLQDDATVLVARDATLAIRMILSKRPDIVLLDDSMPNGMGGLQLLEHVRGLPHDPLAESLVIMVTANNRAQNFRRAMAAGAIDYITKPFSIDMIRKKVLKRIERRRKTVLVVDDDADSRNILASCVLGAGYRCAEAIDAGTAMATLRETRPDLVLLDQGLPDHDGISVLKTIRTLPDLADLPVVMITADRSTPTVQRAHESGANDYCPKPVVPKDVVARCVRQIG